MEALKTIITATMIAICFLAFCHGLFPPDPPKRKKGKKKKSKFPKCDCSDVNECSKWYGVTLNMLLIKTFKMEKYSITEVCPHDIAVTRTLTATCGCETTAEFCIECGEQTSEPKTEC